jgi:toxin YoeB
MRSIKFDAVAFQDYQEWIRTNPKIALRIDNLLHDILRDPFSGIGKPEALKHNWQGYWARRITEEHRLVYKVTPDTIIIATCKYHYA